MKRQLKTTRGRQNSAQVSTDSHIRIHLPTLLAIILIILCGSLVYSNGLPNGFIRDDTTQLVNNPLVHSLLYIPQLLSGGLFYNGKGFIPGEFYRPLVSIIYTMIYVSFGANAFAFHFIQLCIHIINAVLVFLVFRYFFKTSLSLILSLIFLLHPMNSETVSYIALMDDILFFFFGSLAFYLQLSMAESYKKHLWIALLLFLSLFSKETGVLFIAVVLFHQYLFRRKNVIKTLITSIGVLFIYGYFYIFVNRVPFTQSAPYAPITELSLPDRLFTVPSVILYYLKTAFLPIHLAIYQVWVINFENLTKFYLAATVDLFIIVLTILLGVSIYKKHHKYFNGYLFFTFWLWIGLLFYSQIFFVLDSTVADRWFYFPLVGLIGLAGVLIQIYIPRTKIIITICYLSSFLIISMLGFRTYIRNANFHDDYTLATHDIVYSPDSSILALDLGNQLLNQGHFTTAEPYLQTAIRLDPIDPESWYALGTIYEQTGKIKAALYAYQTAVNVSDYPPAYNSYAILLFQHHKLDTALKVTNKGLGMFPSDGQLWLIKSFIEYKKKNNNEALEAAKNALSFTPSNLTYVVYTLLSRHLQFNVYIIWLNQKRVIGVKQS